MTQPEPSGNPGELPRVVCLMLTRNRPAMARQAIECFRRQTYPNKHLMIVNSDQLPLLRAETKSMSEPCIIGVDAMSIGQLRNEGIRRSEDADIIVHWDDDDWSAPGRIGDQVELIQGSGSVIVGYNQMPFWRTEEREAWVYCAKKPTDVLGTSLCYWRKTWESRQFRNTSIGEDHDFLRGRKVDGVLAVHLMVARIHPGNTSQAYAPAKMRVAKEWTRRQDLDGTLSQRFAR